MGVIYYNDNNYKNDTPEDTKRFIKRVGVMLHVYGFDEVLDNTLFKVKNYDNLYFVISNEICRVEGGETQECEFIYVLCFYAKNSDVLILDRIKSNSSHGKKLKDSHIYKLKLLGLEADMFK